MYCFPLSLSLSTATVMVFTLHGWCSSSMYLHSSCSCGTRRRRRDRKHQPKTWPWPTNPSILDDRNTTTKKIIILIYKQAKMYIEKTARHANWLAINLKRFSFLHSCNGFSLPPQSRCCMSRLASSNIERSNQMKYENNICAIQISIMVLLKLGIECSRAWNWRWTWFYW